MTRKMRIYEVIMISVPHVHACGSSMSLCAVSAFAKMRLVQNVGRLYIWRIATLVDAMTVPSLIQVRRDKITSFGLKNNEYRARADIHPSEAIYLWPGFNLIVISSNRYFSYSKTGTLEDVGYWRCATKI